MNQVNSGWYQVVISDPALLSGMSVRRFLEPLVNLLSLRYVLPKDLSGAIAELLTFSGTIMSTREFMQHVEHAAQYDWAFFHFYSARPIGKDDLDDITTIEHSDLTIRLVDGSHFFVYSKSPEVLQQLKCNYLLSECIFGELKDFVIPY